jgi:hypothetical protein
LVAGHEALWGPRQDHEPHPYRPCRVRVVAVDNVEGTATIEAPAQPPVAELLADGVKVTCCYGFGFVSSCSGRVVTADVLGDESRVSELRGSIALVERGALREERATFASKAADLQAAGAVAMVATNLHGAYCTSRLRPQGAFNE